MKKSTKKSIIERIVKELIIRFDNIYNKNINQKIFYYKILFIE